MFSSSIEGRTAPTGRAPNLPGDKYGRLVLVGEMVGQSCSPSLRRWVVMCDCGESLQVLLSNLRGGTSTSCGCYNREYASARATTHGLGNHPLYNTHRNMMKRCHSPEHRQFSDYGGRGIFVCERWHSVENFISDTYPSYLEGRSLERIDNNLGYSPDNCVWATNVEQARNKRNNRLVSYLGKNLCLKDAAKVTGLPYKRVHHRLKAYGWSIPRALESENFQEPLLESAQTPEPSHV